MAQVPRQPRTGFGANGLNPDDAPNSTAWHLPVIAAAGGTSALFSNVA
jgi:hypothetical protein